MTTSASDGDAARRAASPASPAPSPRPPARPRVRPGPRPVEDPTLEPPLPLSTGPEPDTTGEVEQPAAAYEVGYKKPPKATQFKPGQSGNPQGRAKGAKGLKTMVRQTMTQKVSVRTASGVQKMTRMEATIHKAHELAMKGNVRALAQIIALYASAVPDPVETTSLATPEDLSATDFAMLDELRRSLTPATPESAPSNEPPAAPAASPDLAADSDAERGPSEPGPGSVPNQNPPRNPDPGSDWDRTL